MGRVHERLDRRLRELIERQHLFFVATAPLEGGHVNVSPKGVGGTFTVVDAGQVAYLDVTAASTTTSSPPGFRGSPRHEELGRCEDGLADYRRKNNRTSIDGLPAFDHDPA